MHGHGKTNARKMFLRRKKRPLVELNKKQNRKHRNQNEPSGVFNVVRNNANKDRGSSPIEMDTNAKTTACEIPNATGNAERKKKDIAAVDFVGADRKRKRTRTNAHKTTGIRRARRAAP
jgi:hypothetical protein